MKVMDEEEQEDEAVPSKGLTKGEPGRPYTTMIPGKMKSKSKRREEKMERPRSRLIRWAGARNEVEKEKEKDEPEPSTSKGEVLPRSSPIWMSLMTRTSTRISRSNRVRRHHQPKPGLKFKAKSVPPPLLPPSGDNSDEKGVVVLSKKPARTLVSKRARRSIPPKATNPPRRRSRLAPLYLRRK
jgi:hypothetical protein